MLHDLRAFLDLLRNEKELIEISAPVDPHLEAAEIHRRIIEEGGPAILFKNIKGSTFPLVTNLFGTERRIALAFGARPEKLIEEIVKLIHTFMPPTVERIWHSRHTLWDLLKIGTTSSSHAPVTEVVESPPQLTRLPLLTTWDQDGGPFITLPLVYTEHPELKIPNLGMYRLQRFDDQTTGFHCQIGKGGGFHLEVARQRGEKLPVHVTIGGPPALILSAIAPLPENVPELLFASLVLGKKLALTKNPLGPHRVAAHAEFILVGEVDPIERRPEGPFGDHYGYYSLQHDYPVFRVKGVLRRRDAICTATVVGKPKQEDFFLGDYLQKLLSPLFPVVMPTVQDLWTYGETGYHSLAAAVVQHRYKRETMVSAFRILGEGQLSFTKFLLIVDKKMDLKNFKSVLEYVLARTDLRTDLYLFSNLAMDTLDYTGPKVNEGSKGVLIGTGDPIRSLLSHYEGELPSGIRRIAPYCAGCLLVEGPPHSVEAALPKRIAHHSSLKDWPLVVIVDNVEEAGKDTTRFLWTTFTRFEPGADIHTHSKEIVRNHIAYSPPLVIDARMKPSYPDELVCDEKTSALVSKRWNEYFPRG